LIESIIDTVIPKLVASDVNLFHSLIQDVFPGVDCKQSVPNDLRQAVLKECEKHRLSFALADGSDSKWLNKVWQTYHIQKLHHGLMMVGPSGCGKTRAWSVLLAAMEKVELVKYE
jgi:dynein heavy chain 1